KAIAYLPCRRGIIDLPRQFAEIPAPHLCRRNRVDESARQPLPEAVVITEEEGAVLDNGPANRAAELILLKWRLLVSRLKKEVFRIKRGVSDELIARAMKIIGARLGHHVHLPTGVTALLGRKEIGLNLELLDRFDGWADHDSQRQPVVVINPV